MRENGECTVRLNENEYITLTLASLRELLKNWENTLSESTDVCLIKWIGETNAYKSDEVEASRRVLRSFREFVLNNTKTEKVVAL